MGLSFLIFGILSWCWNREGVACIWRRKKGAHGAGALEAGCQLSECVCVKYKNTREHWPWGLGVQAPALDQLLTAQTVVLIFSEMRLWLDGLLNHFPL